ncbi:FAD-dependent thymidylate synthase [Candidatus Woesearchaeota archaeon]|nr:FAD-dependent thymidylate synthase [Candidatus Woesearchaeota archaeon]
MKKSYSSAAQTILGYLLSHPFDRVSLLTHVPPEVKATLQAMYSRNDLAMRDTLLKTIVMVELDLKKASDYDALPQEKKEEVYEKYAATLPTDDPPLYHLFDNKAKGFLAEWAIKHGHGSIKEGAFIPYIVEGVSLITAKALEDDNLFHGQELSTRYKSFARQTVKIPPVLAASPLKDELETYFKESLDRYLSATRVLQDYQHKAFPAPADISPAGWKNVLNAEAFDNARYYLNAGITTSLGIVEDARTLERKLRNMLVFPFPETQQVAAEIIKKAKDELPTLLTHVTPNSYRQHLEQDMNALLEECMGPAKPTVPLSRVRLLHATPDFENRMIADVLYGEGRHGHDWDAVYKTVIHMPLKTKSAVLEQALDKLGKHDDPPRCLRGVRIRYELYPDYGAWRDIQRQRRCNQTFPVPTCSYGYDVPWLLAEAGLEQHYHDHQQRAQEIYEKAAAINPAEAMIIPTLGFRVKQLFEADVEELMYVWRLRTTEYGHFSYRQIFLETFEQAKQSMPLLAGIIEQKKLITKGEVHHGRFVEEKRYEDKMRSR